TGIRSDCTCESTLDKSKLPEPGLREVLSSTTAPRFSVQPMPPRTLGFGARFAPARYRCGRTSSASERWARAEPDAKAKAAIVNAFRNMLRTGALSGHFTNNDQVRMMGVPCFRTRKHALEYQSMAPSTCFETWSL